MNRREAAAIARAARASRAPCLEDRFWSKVDRRSEDECWPWKAALRRKDQGYGAFWLHGRHQPANRVALILSGIEVQPGMEACHTCDNPKCCNPKHLFAGTRQQNNDDKIAKGRGVMGEKVWTSKLTVEQVAFIRSHKPEGVKRLPNGLPEKLAAQFGVSRQYISEVISSGWIGI